MVHTKNEFKSNEKELKQKKNEEGNVNQMWYKPHYTHSVQIHPEVQKYT